MFLLVVVPERGHQFRHDDAVGVLGEQSDHEHPVGSQVDVDKPPTQSLVVFRHVPKKQGHLPLLTQVEL